ncbi:LysR family transcriptional regulator [uncultured Devosia sp.]|uniref:LysR family transcriptional regulator n=1 Tax=uncultured Devosia sp. TaxID=211434 RepID=UPI0035CB8C2F
MRELRQFVEVASRHSISAAAKHLNISQPALSRAIQKLEQSYGAPLFVRNGAGMELSPYGSALYSRAVQIIPALDEVREEIEQLQGRAKAAIRIAAGDYWGHIVLPDVTRRFCEARRNVLVHLDIADEGKRLEGLRNGVYDIVFGTMSSRYGLVMDVQFEPMSRQSTYVYCDKTHPLAGRKASNEEFMALRWINPGYDDDSGSGRLARQARDFAIRADTTMNALLLLRGSGLVLSASSGFMQLFAAFGITRIDIEDPGEATDSGAIHARNALNRPNVRDYLNLARDHASALADERKV